MNIPTSDNSRFLERVIMGVVGGLLTLILAQEVHRREQIEERVIALQVQMAGQTATMSTLSSTIGRLEAALEEHRRDHAEHRSKP